MEKIENILVPLDGSRSSLKGLKLASRIAKPLGAKITGINVVRYSLGFQFPVSSEIRQKHIKGSEAIITEAKNSVRKDKVSFIGKILKGENIGKTITKFSKTKKFDLIIIGSRGPDPGSEIFLGSVANYLLHKSKIPIIIVK
jgi:nucleotide-binding universal stress UspA family protein